MGVWGFRVLVLVYGFRVLVWGFEGLGVWGFRVLVWGFWGLGVYGFRVQGLSASGQGSTDPGAAPQTPSPKPQTV